MNNQENISPTFAFFILISSILLIFFLTLQPFNFAISGGLSFATVLDNFYYTTTLNDFLINLFLLTPFGFSFAWVCSIKKININALFFLTILASFSFSLTIELVQTFSPVRNSNTMDLIANTISGGFGLIIFRYCRNYIFQGIKFLLNPQKLSLVLTAYLTFALILSATLPNATQLNNWDNFPLALGNELNRKRPWQGQVYQFYLANRTLSQAELTTALTGTNPFNDNPNGLIAAYEIVGNYNYPDKAGNLKDLTWQNATPKFAANEPVLLNKQNWLATTSPIKLISQRVKETSQFTIIATIATNKTEQVGPARIISHSQDNRLRNFSLSQYHSDLSFRFRTPITSKNGNKPELIVPNVFSDTQPHNIVVSYDGYQVLFYIDQLENNYTVPLIPGIGFYELANPFPSPWRIHLESDYFGIYNLFYYELIFIPLGILTALITIVFQNQIIKQILLISLVIFLPPLFLEAIWIIGKGKKFSGENVLLSLAITLGTMVIIKVAILSWRTIKPTNP